MIRAFILIDDDNQRIDASPSAPECRACCPFHEGPGVMILRHQEDTLWTYRCLCCGRKGIASGYIPKRSRETL